MSFTYKGAFQILISFFLIPLVQKSVMPWNSGKTKKEVKTWRELSCLIKPQLSQLYIFGQLINFPVLQFPHL